MTVTISFDDYLAHYGTPRRSGRYPWGSGGNDSGQNSMHFLQYVEDQKRQGLSEVEIARGAGISVTDLRNMKSIAKNEKKQSDIAMAQRLKEKGLSNVAIGERMQINESSVRALLAPGQKDKADVLSTTTDMLAGQVAKKKFVDVGTGVENHIGVSRTKLNTAIAALEDQGYKVIPVQVDQLGTGAGKKTTIKVLAPPGTTYTDVVKNIDQIRQVTDFSEDGGRTFLGIQPPISIKSSRVDIRYAEQGGTQADGVIYVRPGVDDISLGGARYAQVRIAVDGTHYLKGMAMYKDDLPRGVDLQFNTNKSDTGNKKDAMKGMKDDPDNPFGAVVRQITHPETGKVTSAMNLVNAEGDWETWSKNLSSQFLSKQSPALAKTQLDMTYATKKNELDEIMSLTNPSVRKKLLEAYADGADASSVHLKAAALPRQASHVILPITTMKETEVYAPNYRNGERVVLVRYHHGGTFELPELVVNNRQRDAKKALADTRDAIGIHPKVAERLSGADFDGDSVLVIPNESGKIKTSPALAGLKDFDTKSAYPAYHGMHTIDGGTWNAKTKSVEFPPGKHSSPRGKGTEMGRVSNLITDMTIQGAKGDELARAVRHSMVVIDSEKHSLNYKQSEIDNGIPSLMKKYQGRTRGGASTLISRAGARLDVPLRRDRRASEGGAIDPATGRKVYVPTGESYVKNGKTIVKTFKSKKLAETDNAFTLSSGTGIEKVYAEHSNRMKDLANQARKASLSSKSPPASPSAKTAYSNEVASLNAKLNVAIKNRPLERQAQVIANSVVHAKRAANPEMGTPEIKRLQSQALNEARTRTGAGKQRIHITDSEWDAIQAGAISPSKLNDILNNADLDQVKKLATPKSSVLMTSAKENRAKAMAASGYTQAEIADALGVSLTTLKRSIGGQ